MQGRQWRVLLVWVAMGVILLGATNTGIALPQAQPRVARCSKQDTQGRRNGHRRFPWRSGQRLPPHQLPLAKRQEDAPLRALWRRHQAPYHVVNMGHSAQQKLKEVATLWSALAAVFMLTEGQQIGDPLQRLMDGDVPAFLHGVVDASYFAAQTALSIGFGDLVPHSIAAKIAIPVLCSLIYIKTAQAMAVYLEQLNEQRTQQLHGTSLSLFKAPFWGQTPAQQTVLMLGGSPDPAFTLRVRRDLIHSGVLSPEKALVLWNSAWRKDGLPQLLQHAAGLRFYSGDLGDLTAVEEPAWTNATHVIGWSGSPEDDDRLLAAVARLTQARQSRGLPNVPTVVQLHNDRHTVALARQGATTVSGSGLAFSSFGAALGRVPQWMELHRELTSPGGKLRLGFLPVGNSNALPSWPELVAKLASTGVLVGYRRPDGAFIRPTAANRYRLEAVGDLVLVVRNPEDGPQPLDGRQVGQALGYAEEASPFGLEASFPSMLFGQTASAQSIEGAKRNSDELRSVVLLHLPQANGGDQTHAAQQMADYVERFLSGLTQVGHQGPVKIISRRLGEQDPVRHAIEQRLGRGHQVTLIKGDPHRDVQVLEQAELEKAGLVVVLAQPGTPLETNNMTFALLEELRKFRQPNGVQQPLRLIAEMVGNNERDYALLQSSGAELVDEIRSPSALVTEIGSPGSQQVVRQVFDPDSGYPVSCSLPEAYRGMSWRQVLAGLVELGTPLRLVDTTGMIHELPAGTDVDVPLNQWAGLDGAQPSALQMLTAQRYQQAPTAEELGRALQRVHDWRTTK